MILIQKSAEPASWTERRKTPGAEYSPTDDLRAVLVSEQRHICAFCMRRIPLAKKEDGVTSKIAHLLSRSEHPELQMDYRNMVICCPGNLDGNPHCDKAQGNADISLPIFDSRLQASIRYSSTSGAIISNNADWDNQICNILNLNHKTLKANRLDALKGLRQVLDAKGWKTSKIKEELSRLKDTSRKQTPYAGILIWYLDKKLKTKTA